MVPYITISKKIEFNLKSSKNVLQRIIDLFKPKPQVMLGRWIRTTPPLTKIKIDYAHCGTCSQNKNYSKTK